MQINQLKYAVQVAKLLSFSKAADQLCVTQPALSHQIQKLEEEIGVSPFRAQNPFRQKLTYAGEVFVSGAGKILTDLETLRKSMQEIRLARTGNIRVGTTSAHIVPDLFAHVSAFQKQCPGIRVQIVETAGSLSLADMLANGGVDAAFLISSAEDYAGCQNPVLPLDPRTRCLGRQRSAPVCRKKANPLAGTLPIRPFISRYARSACMRWRSRYAAKAVLSRKYSASVIRWIRFSIL